jgi:hypothetical protein
VIPANLSKNNVITRKIIKLVQPVIRRKSRSLFSLLGNYAIAWTPSGSGLYTITATFAGTNSYYSSKAGTSIAVSAASAASASPSPSTAPQPTSGVPTTTYIAIAAAVVIIAVIAAALVLRRRK